MIDEQLEILNQNITRLVAALLTQAEMQRYSMTDPYYNEILQMDTYEKFQRYFSKLLEADLQLARSRVSK